MRTMDASENELAPPSLTCNADETYRACKAATPSSGATGVAPKSKR